MREALFLDNLIPPHITTLDKNKTAMKQTPKRLAEIQVRYSHKVAKKDKPQILKSQDVFDILCEIWDHATIGYQERFYVLFLNRANRVMGYKCVSVGGTAGTVVDAKHIFGIAVKCNASSIILAHNHPSSNHSPSQNDVDLTRKLVKGGEFLDITVLDHVIITPDFRYYSFADEGVI
jgi:DNA repair protein RadC